MAVDCGVIKTVIAGDRIARRKAAEPLIAAKSAAIEPAPLCLDKIAADGCHFTDLRRRDARDRVGKNGNWIAQRPLERGERYRGADLDRAIRAGVDALQL